MSEHISLLDDCAALFSSHITANLTRVSKGFMKYQAPTSIHEAEKLEVPLPGSATTDPGVPGPLRRAAE